MSGTRFGGVLLGLAMYLVVLELLLVVLSWVEPGVGLSPLNVSMVMWQVWWMCEVSRWASLWCITGSSRGELGDVGGFLGCHLGFWGEQFHSIEATACFNERASVRGQPLGRIPIPIPCTYYFTS